MNFFAAEPQEEEIEIINLNELDVLVTPGAKIETSSNILQKAKDVTSWTVKSALKFFEAHSESISLERITELLPIMVKNLSIADTFKLLEELGEQIQDIAGLIGRRSGENDSEFTSIYGKGAENISKVAELVNHIIATVFKDRDGDDAKAAFTSLCTTMWFEGLEDPLLLEFLNHLCVEWEIEDIVKFLSNYDAESVELMPFLLSFTSKWDQDSKDTLVETIGEEWTWSRKELEILSDAIGVNYDVIPKTLKKPAKKSPAGKARARAKPSRDAGPDIDPSEFMDALNGDFMDALRAQGLSMEDVMKAAGGFAGNFAGAEAFFEGGDDDEEDVDEDDLPDLEDA